MTIEVSAFYHADTFTFSYLLVDIATDKAAVIDPVMDYDMKSGHCGLVSADKILAEIEHRNLELLWVLETHAHADHVTAAQYFKQRCGAQVVIGAAITEVQSTFAGVFNLGKTLDCDGRQFDRLVQEGDRLALGNSEILVMQTPGHTPACVAYRVTEGVFVGDTFFMPDVGTARADFPGGDAAQLYQSLQRLLDLPDETRMYLCHDYPETRPEVCYQVSVKQQKVENIHIAGGVSEADYIALRTEKDKTLAVPQLLLPAIQLNIRGGGWPSPESNGQCYLKIPLTLPAGMDNPG